MAVAHVATGTALSGNAGTTNVSIARPGSGNSAGNITLVGRSIKPESATGSNESGWSNIVAGTTGGTGTTGVDVGLTRIVVDHQTLAGGESGSITFDQANSPNSVAGCMITYSKSLSAWELVATTGDDNTHGTGRSATGSAISLQAGDVLVVFVASDTDSTTAYTSPSITASGMTITTTQRLGASGVSQNNDCGLAIFEGAITAGSVASVAPSISLSGGPSSCGPVAFVRLREVGTTVNATLAGPLGALTSSISAAPEHPATLAAPLGSLTGTLSATVTPPAVEATLAAPLGSLASSLTASVEHPATLAAPLGSLSGTITATVEHGATLAAPLGALTAAATATVEHVVEATATAALGALTASLSATVEEGDPILPAPGDSAGGAAPHNIGPAQQIDAPDVVLQISFSSSAGPGAAVTANAAARSVRLSTRTRFATISTPEVRTRCRAHARAGMARADGPETRTLRNDDDELIVLLASRMAQ